MLGNYQQTAALSSPVMMVMMMVMQFLGALRLSHSFQSDVQLWSFTRSGRPSGDGRSRLPADFEPHNSFILQHAGTRRAKIF